MNKVTFFSKADAEKYLTPTNVISIGPKGSVANFICQHKRVLTLEFDDVIGFVGSNDFDVFDITMANRIVDFVQKCQGEDILVHCEAGMSRSAAVADFISVTYGYTLDLSPPCFGTTMYKNSHVYDTLRGVVTQSLASYYADLEAKDRW